METKKIQFMLENKFGMKTPATQALPTRHEVENAYREYCLDSSNLGKLSSYVDLARRHQ